MSITEWRTGEHRPWLTLIGMLFAKQSTKGIEGSEWEDLYEHYTDVSMAAGARKPNESQKAKIVWKMKAARGQWRGFYDPERKDNILGRGKTRLELWKEPVKDPIVALDKALKCLEKPCC